MGGNNDFIYGFLVGMLAGGVFGVLVMIVREYECGHKWRSD